MLPVLVLFRMCLGNLTPTRRSTKRPARFFSVAMVESLKSRLAKMCPALWPKLSWIRLVNAYVVSALRRIYWMIASPVTKCKRYCLPALLGCSDCHAFIWHVFSSAVTTEQLCPHSAIFHWLSIEHPEGRCLKTTATMDDGVALGSTVSVRELAKAGTGGRGLVATAQAPRMEEAKARMHP